MAETYDNTPTDTFPRTASSPLLLLVSWLVVGLPLAWGIMETLHKATALFH